MTYKYIYIQLFIIISFQLTGGGGGREEGVIYIEDQD